MTSYMDDRTQHDWKPTHPPVGRYSGMAEKMWRKRDNLLEAGMDYGKVDREMISEMETAAVLLGKVERGETIITTRLTPSQQDEKLAWLLFDLRIKEDVYATAIDDWAVGCLDCPWEIANIARIAADLAGDMYRLAMVAYGRMPRPEPIEPIEF